MNNHAFRVGMFVLPIMELVKKEYGSALVVMHIFVVASCPSQRFVSMDSTKIAMES